MLNIKKISNLTNSDGQDIIEETGNWYIVDAYTGV